MPFSFDYDDRPFPEGFERSPQGAEVWAHPSGLTVTVESTFDPDTGAEEWTLWFENRGEADSAPLTNVYPLDARAAFPDGCTVTTAKGTSGKIDDFALVNHALAAGESKEYAACGSRAYIPFFNVGGEHAGAVCALGWTGRWFVKVETYEGGARVSVYPHWEYQAQGQPKWFQRFRKAMKETGFPPWLDVSGPVRVFVPAGVRLKLRFRASHTSSCVPEPDERVLDLSPGETKDLGELKFVPARKPTPATNRNPPVSQPAAHPSVHVGRNVSRLATVCLFRED